MVYLVPFYKNASFKIKEAPEVIDFVKYKSYDYHKFLSCLNVDMCQSKECHGRAIQ